MMSFRLLTYRAFNYGRSVLHNTFTKRSIHINILGRKNIHQRIDGFSSVKKDEAANLTTSIWRNKSLLRFGQQARRLFVDNVLNRFTPIISADLRKDITKKFLHGDSAPLFGLIGLCLASGTGILTKDDELESVCWEIRETLSQLHDKSTVDFRYDKIGLDDLQVGSPIAKGCSAVVYAANLKNPSAHLQSHDAEPSDANKSQNQPVSGQATGNDEVRSTHHNQKLHNLRNDSTQTTVNDKSNDAMPERSSQDPLALKMLFNYDIQSNSMAILQAMYKETIPAIHKHALFSGDSWENSLKDQTVNLPTHPNIVRIVNYFCAPIPNLMDSTSLYPMALPPRLNPNGYGRNMSLFVLMKRYDSNLYEYLKRLPGTDSTMRIRLLLFAQLLEGVAHLYRHGVAHRDLKSDNILVDVNESNRFPNLVLSDFGCCIADKNNGLCIPYTSMNMDKGGNPALMAPEIITKMPGTFSTLDYSKSDLWACGTIAYEIFGESNPFHTDESANATENNSVTAALKSFNYKDNDLPALNTSISFVVRKLIANILRRNPKNRLEPDIAANVMQLFLWAPSSWLKSSTNVSNPEILQWLLSLTTKILYDCNMKTSDPTNGAFVLHFKRADAEYSLLISFLMRAQLQHIRVALDWIRQIQE